MRVAFRSAGLGLALSAALSVASCSDPASTDQADTQEVGQADKAPPPGEETFNERVARQKRYIPALKRSMLPAPEGDAAEVAQAAIKEAELSCPKVTGAERFDSDGTIIAECGDSQFRVFKVEGLATTMALDCKSGKDLFGIDACDKKQAAKRDDDSIQKLLSALART